MISLCFIVSVGYTCQSFLYAGYHWNFRWMKGLLNVLDFESHWIAHWAQTHLSVLSVLQRSYLCRFWFRILALTLCKQRKIVEINLSSYQRLLLIRYIAIGSSYNETYLAASIWSSKLAFISSISFGFLTNRAFGFRCTYRSWLSSFLTCFSSQLVFPFARHS